MKILPIKDAYILVVTLFCGHISGKREETTPEVGNVIDKYMQAVNKLSANFPNHQIELHLDLTKEDRIPQRRFKYIHLRKPEPLTGRSNDMNISEEKQASSPLVSTSDTTDADMQPVYMKDLKKAIKDMERKYSKLTIEPNHTPYVPKPRLKMKNILQLLNRGILVNHDVKKPKENMSWFKIKIPK